MKFWPLRKGCKRCSQKLVNTREKITRYCDRCAAGALDGFQDMAQGNIKQGLNKVLAGSPEAEKAFVEAKLAKAVNTKAGRKAVKVALKKEGLPHDDATIDEYMTKFSKEDKTIESIK